MKTTKEQIIAERMSKLRAKHEKKQAQQQRWDEQRKAADAMPAEELFEKARSGKQLNPSEAQRIYNLHAEQAQKLTAEVEVNNRIVTRIKKLETKLRDQQFFTAELAKVATTHDDKLSSGVCCVTWGRAANLVSKLIEKPA